MKHSRAYKRKQQSHREAVNTGLADTFKASQARHNEAIEFLGQATPAGQLKKLRQAIEALGVATKPQRLARLTQFAIADVKEPITARDAISAISEINKMVGDYAPERHAFLGEVILRIVEENDDNGRGEATEGTNNTCQELEAPHETD